jgi:hypothetical protein
MSGERKTAVMNALRRPLDEWERNRRRELSPQIAEAESRRAILAQRLKEAEKEATKDGTTAVAAEERAMELARELAEHEVPSLPQLTTSDTTQEAVAILCAENDGRIAIFSDEGETVKNIAGRYSKDQSPSVEFYLKGYSGGYYSSNRVGREGISLQDPALVMVLAIQPVVVRGIANQRALHGQGFFARPLYAQPSSALGSRKSRPDPVDDRTREAYETLIKALLDMPLPKDEDGEISPYILRFSEAADKLLEDLQDWVEPQLGPNGEMRWFREWASKFAGQVVRIAGILHVADRVATGGERPWETPVERPTLMRAIEIGLCYLQHSRAALGEMGADPLVDSARHILEVIKRDNAARISKRDLFDKVHKASRFKTVKDLEPVIEVLKDHGYVRELKPKHRGAGRPPSIVLEINPLPPTTLPHNPHNPHNSTSTGVKPFFEWLEERRGPEEPPPSPAPTDPDPADPGPDPEVSSPTSRADTYDVPDVGDADGAGEALNPNGHVPSMEVMDPICETEGAKEYSLVADPDRVAEAAAFLDSVTEVEGFDLETTGLSPIEDKVRLLSLRAGDETFLIDCFAVEPSPVLEVLKDKVLYIHGAEFDLPFLYHAYGFVPTKTPIDTLQLSQVTRAGEWGAKEEGGWQRIRHSLKEALMRELGVEVGGKKKYQNGKAWQGDLTEEHLEYAANDVIYLKRLADKLFTLLEEHGQEEIWKLEQRAKPLFLEMCYRGIPFDKERWDGLVGELEGRVLQLKEHADAKAPPHRPGEEWNWSSQKARDAFKLAGLDIPNLQRETLSRYKDPFIVAVSKYRDANNELSRVRTWYEGRYKDGRIHPKWNPAGAVTGRASCSSPNIQSLTKEGGYRSCIRP